MDRLVLPHLTVAMDTHDQDTTLVIGGTGKTGRRIVKRLRERGLRVRSASRAGEPPFHWEDPATWAPALRGARSAYVSFFPDLAVPGAPEATAASPAMPSVSASAAGAALGPR